ncbi:MAG: MlaD family protein [Spirochaetes bacterium]|nr:MlaD family protein [Spirochaetota bacterium]
MKFAIRHADKIVGGLILIGIGVLLFVIFMMGSNQRWFARDYEYVTFLSSATGISRNMPVQFRGFTIGYVQSFVLTDDDRVEVVFTIFDIYNSRVLEGSVIDVAVSPIGLGSQFLFHPGIGERQLPEGSLIPYINSPEGILTIAGGLANAPDSGDSIGDIINQVAEIMETVGFIMTDVHGALQGTDETSIGRTLGHVEMTAAGAAELTQTLSTDILALLEHFMFQVDPILEDFQGLTARLADPSGTVMSILDGDGPFYESLVESLGAITGTLASIEQTAQFIPSQLPMLGILLASLHSTLSAAEDVLIALTNNPLLRRGVPQRIEMHPGGTTARDLEF